MHGNGSTIPRSGLARFGRECESWLNCWAWSQPATPDEAAGNRATVAGVDSKVATALAEIGGLRELVKSETGSIQRQLEPLAGLPVAVATLRSDLTALDEREQKSDEAMDGRVSALENRNSRLSTQRWALIVAVVGSLVVDLASHIHIP